MQKDKMIKLIEDMASAGYEIVKIDKLYDIEKYKYHGDIEILPSLPSAVAEPLSKEELIKLIEVLSSNNYAILEYKLPFDNDYYRFREIKLILQGV
jgi:hypothetical protein